MRLGLADTPLKLHLNGSTPTGLSQKKNKARSGEG